ncbi:hypothetical protein PVAND_007288 [Polypedilum vanderplanki]|uniref:RING-type domain-containing protein n=1 Tax=Polypedilum vanderplanki TaxID=319348 RepID=A0A9J6C6Q8_POLVA|nr:hypothetical protein PVAND_007288 [Polypedilum vanderplanki]
MDFVQIFPIEISEIIFQHLTVKELLKTTLVSKSWNKFIGESRSLMKNVQIVIDLNNGRKKYKKILTNSSRIYQHVVLNKFSKISKKKNFKLKKFKVKIKNFYSLMCSSQVTNINSLDLFVHPSMTQEDNRRKKKMVKIDIEKEKLTMESTKKMDKIQIFPSQKQHNSFNNKNKPKLIMSPLTTMPNAKKLMIAANALPMKPLMANENNCSATKETNNVKIIKTSPPPPPLLNSTILQTTAVKVIPSMPVMNDKQPQPLDGKTTSVDVEKNNRKETAGCRSEKEKITLGDVHPYITCFLCKGYLIEATTIVECLHTYCHSCLMKHLSREKCCPQCDMSINKSKTNIKYDATIQSIVYKLVPGLYEKELLRRRAFYKQRPEEAKLATPEERGDDTEHLIFSPSDLMSLSLDYAEKETLKGMENDASVQNLLKPKYLNCPAIFKVEYLKKFIMNKFLINNNRFNVEISYKVKTIVLPEHYTLMDVAYIYTWKKEAPMPFFFRIIAKNSKCNELPEVSLRRSPTSLTSKNDDSDTSTSITSSKKKSVSFKEDVESSRIKATTTENKVSSGVSKTSPPENPQPRVESIKLKFDPSNNNVSIIKPDGTVEVKPHKKEKRDKESKKNANRFESFLNELKSTPSEKKDEYEFDDEIERQKLGFLNTFQLTAKKMLIPKGNVQNNNKTKKDENSSSSSSEEGKNLLSKTSTENNNNSNSNSSKRKNKEPVKTEKAKKYKFHEMKSLSEENKFLFTKTGDGHEIKFDMSPKPLGSKPPLSKVKSDILMAQQRADAKAIQSKTETTTANVATNNTNNNTNSSNEKAKNIPAKQPKKLPLLLPKQPPAVTQTAIAPSLMSPTAFVIKKPDPKQSTDIATTSEISVTKINDQSHQYRVYGPKTPEKKKSESAEFKPPADVFAQPLPPKPKANSPALPPTSASSQTHTAQKPFGFAPKQPKNIPENMQTPYGSRTPFYVPSSPSYTPNFDPKPQFKYANPNAYASFMQSMFCADKISPPPINSMPAPKTSTESRKRLSPNDNSPVPSKRKSPSPTKTATTVNNGNKEPETKAISILNKINFPSSLSVTLTNEQEENKKEQLRNQSQSVNNNIEIIKISDETEAKMSAAVSKSQSSPKEGKSSSAAATSEESKPVQKKLPELKKLSPILPAPTPPTSSNNKMLPPSSSSVLNQPPVKFNESKESFQRAFLESLMHVTKNSEINKTNNSQRKKEAKPAIDALKPLNSKDLESKLESKKDNAAVSQQKKNLSLTPPLTKNNSEKSNALKSLTPPPPIPMQEHGFFSPAVASASAMQFNFMLNALNAAASNAQFPFPNPIDIQRTMMLETLRKNVETSSALLAMRHHHQLQQQNQKISPKSSSSSSNSSSSSSKH